MKDILVADNSPNPHIQNLYSRSLKEIVNNYISYYASGDNHTARAKRYDLEHFLKYLAGSPSAIKDLKLSNWTLQSTNDFINTRLSQGEAPSTVSRRLATLKHFGRTLADRFPEFINPAREAKSPKVSNSKPDGLSKSEVMFLKTALEEYQQRRKMDFLSFRNCFLLEVLMETGLRADEVRKLSVGQISEDYNWFKSVQTKGRKFRKVYISSFLKDKLLNYLEQREIYINKSFPDYSSLSEKEKMLFPLFISLRSAHLDSAKSFGLAPKTIWRIISDFGKSASSFLNTSSNIKLHPHKLRHTFAHGLLNSSKDIRLVAQALGHSDVRVTMRYTERSDEEIAKAIENKQ